MWSRWIRPKIQHARRCELHNKPEGSRSVSEQTAPAAPREDAGHRRGAAARRPQPGHLAWLDAQREAAVALLDRLQGWARTVETARRGHAAFLASDAGQHQVDLVILRSCRLVLMLGQIAMATPRADGWTLLSRAGQLIKRDAPDELEELGQRFGQPNLKGVLTATELFDVADEPTPGGGTRTIYRINERWRLESPGADATA
jgi:hypothetical protein